MAKFRGQFQGGRTKIIESEELKARLSEQEERLTESLQHNRELNMEGRNSSLLVAEMELRASGIELGSNAAASICSCLPAVLQQQVPPANDSPSQGTSPVSMSPSIVSNASLKSNSFRTSLDVHNLNVISRGGFNILRSSLGSSSRGSVTASNNIISRTAQSTSTLDLSKVVKRTAVRSCNVQGLPTRSSSHSSSSLVAVASATSGGGEGTRNEAQPLTLHYSPMSPTSSRCIIKAGASSQGFTPHLSTPIHTYSASSSASSELPRLSSHYHNAFLSSYSNNSAGQKYSLSEPLPQLSQLIISSDKTSTPSSSPTDASIITSNQHTSLQNSALPLLPTERNHNLHHHNGLEWDDCPFEGSVALLGSYPEGDHNIVVKGPFNQTLQIPLSDGSELSDGAHSSRDYETTTTLQSEQQGQYACGSPSSSQTGVSPPSKSTQICVELRPRPLDDGELQAVKYQSAAATYRRFSVEIPQQMQVIQVDQQRHYSSVKMQQQIKVVQQNRTLHKSYSNPLLPRATSLGQDPSPQPQSAVQHFSSTTAHPVATSSYSNAACPSKCVKGKPFFHSQSFGSWNLTNIARGKVKMSQQLNRGRADDAEAEVLRAGGSQLASKCSSVTTREQCAMLQPSSIITTWKDHPVIREDSVVGIHLKRAASFEGRDDSNATPAVTASLQIGISTIAKDEMLVQAAGSQQLSRRLSLSRLRRSSVVINSMSTEAGKGEGLEGLPDAVNEMTEYSSFRSPSEPPGWRNSSSSLMITSFKSHPGSPGVEAAEDVVPAGLYTYPTEPSFPPATSAVAVATNKRYQAAVEVAVDSSAGGPLFDTPKLVYSHKPLGLRESKRQLVKTVVVTEAEACAVGPTAMPIVSNNIDQAAGFESSSSRNHLKNAERGLVRRLQQLLARRGLEEDEKHDDGDYNAENTSAVPLLLSNYEANMTTALQDAEHFKMMNNDGNAAAAGKQPIRTDATTEHTIQHTAASLLVEGSSSDRIPSSQIVGKIDSCNPPALRSMSLLKLRLKSNKDEVPEYCSLPPSQLMSHNLEVTPQAHLRSLEYLVLGSSSTEVVATSHKVEQLDLLASSSDDIQQPTGTACNPPHKESLSQLRDHEESMGSAAQSAASSLLDQQPSLLVEPSFINYSSPYNLNPELSALDLIQVRSESDSAGSMVRAVDCDELSSLGTTVTLYCSRLPKVQAFLAASPSTTDDSEASPDSHLIHT